MLKLDKQAKDAGVTVMNEIGVSLRVPLLFVDMSDNSQLDLGIGHLYAVSFIERVHRAGGKTKSFAYIAAA